MTSLERLQTVRHTVEERLLAERNDEGHWTGALSTSALSTATVTFALTLVDRARAASGRDTPSHADLIRRGHQWLTRNANSDGGWGDTVKSVSNLSTTTLCWAALSAGELNESQRVALKRAESWILERAGSLEPAALSEAISAIYGKDRTFSVPILTMCALAERLGPNSSGWKWVRSLPFEFAICPRSWFRNLGLQVVSYALPALIAVGQVHHHHHPSRNPLLRWTRDWARRPTLRLLQDIQPASGGFLEAIPLTAFVTMSLAASEAGDSPPAQAAVRFLENAVLPDGSWPIDTNLATWVTTLSVNALAASSDGLPIEPEEAACVRDWLLRQQYQHVHPYTAAAPGAWAWTDLPGGVPDADDTPGALLALRALGSESAAVRAAAPAGLHWLLDLQNGDGGMPTFCRGWGRLPFDRSGPDLTAHALRCFQAWHDLGGDWQPRLQRGVKRGLAYLKQSQRPNGAWIPLWFGNQYAPNNENPVYGTARVLEALAVVSYAGSEIAPALRRATEWLMSAQNDDGGWGGAPGTPSSIEETALAVHGLSSVFEHSATNIKYDALARGGGWLVERVENGALDNPTPIGFYFASLWYYERLYPPIFTLAALNRFTPLAQTRS